VLEVRPDDAVSIIECDMEVDFAAPIGYQEPTAATNKPANKPNVSYMPSAPKQSEGYRLDGKHTKNISNSSTAAGTSKSLANDSRPASSISALSDSEGKPTRGVPNYDYAFGTLHLNRIKDLSEEPPVKEEKVVKGYKLKHIGNGMVTN